MHQRAVDAVSTVRVAAFASLSEFLHADSCSTVDSTCELAAHVTFLFPLQSMINMRHFCVSTVVYWSCESQQSQSEGSRDARRQLKPCQLLHSSAKTNHIQKSSYSALHGRSAIVS